MKVTSHKHFVGNISRKGWVNGQNGKKVAYLIPTKIKPGYPGFILWTEIFNVN